MTEPAQTPPANPVPAQPAPQPVVAAAPVTPPPAPQPTPTPSGPATTLLEVLVRNGALSQAEADQLLVEQISSGGQIETIIKDKKYVSEEELTKAKAEFYGIPFIRITETGIDPEALSRLPESVARRYQMLPFAINEEDNTLSVAMIDPLDVTAIDFAQQKTGQRVLAYYAVPSEVEQKIAERYAQSLSGEVTLALEETSQIAEQHKKEDDLSALSGGIVRQAPITKIVETILAFAIKSRASDVHIEPQIDRTRIRYRIDGILQEKLILPKSVHDAVVSRIKILSRLKIDEKRIPQDGRFNFVSEGQEVDLRVSTLPTIHGEKIVMRLLKKDMKVPTLPELGLDGLALRHVQDAIKIPHGIILITGPTGSGKTTTLYSILHEINTPKVNIMTLEDPVEYQMGGVNQVQINPQAGLTFASGLRSFLRQDPNIIMVGEIRDTETVSLAIQASLTGHLVFSTLHTSSAAGAIPRLIDMGAETFLLASSLHLVMAQRVVRTLNKKYVEKYTPDPTVVEDIKKVLGPHFEVWCKTNNVDPTKIELCRSAPNRPQNEPEYQGRVGIFEVMPITEEIIQLMVHQATDEKIQEVALKNGMLLMKQDGYAKALQGITTIEEVLRVAEV